jgi:SAM-dependent methyltransferase
MGFVKADWKAFTDRVDSLARQRRTPASSQQPVCLDIGGGSGPLRQLLTRHEFRYVNVDLRRMSGVDVIADVHALPFESASVDLIVSTNCLEHVTKAWIVIPEITRVMKRGAPFAALVPFLHPFHGDDVARFTAYGLKSLLAPLVIEQISVPTHVLTLMGLLPSAMLQRAGLPRASAMLRDGCSVMDTWLTRMGLGFESWAHSYLIVASKP